MSDASLSAAERIAALEADNRRLRELLAATSRLAEVGRFAAKQNHELRQPLFAIKGLAQLLLDREIVDAQEVRDFAKHIVEQSERLTGLVEDLRRLALPVTNGSRAVSDVSAALSSVASLLEWRIRRGVLLRTEIDAEIPPVALEGQRLEQILINLLSNALDAVSGQPKPTIQIRVSLVPGGSGGNRNVEARDPRTDMVDILVADNGGGVLPEARSRLFEDFYTTKGETTKGETTKSERTKGEDSGTGLGLAISREIARNASGDLSLLEQPGRWSEPAVTCFRLTLPAAKEPAT